MVYNEANESNYLRNDMETKIELLSKEFLEKVKQLYVNVIPIKVLKARVYQIGEANVLIRVASKANKTDRFFFGINYITMKKISNLDNPYIRFYLWFN